MEPVGLKSNDGLACVECGRRARFTCFAGPLCPTDALVAAVFTDWIPIPLDELPDPPNWSLEEE